MEMRCVERGAHFKCMMGVVVYARVCIYVYVQRPTSCLFLRRHSLFPFACLFGDTVHYVALAVLLLQVLRLKQNISGMPRFFFPLSDRV